IASGGALPIALGRIWNCWRRRYAYTRCLCDSSGEMLLSMHKILCLRCRDTGMPIQGVYDKIPRMQT
ncbi:hypothetical protein, partial [Anabaena sp. CCY 0017]|uniref:hypothetical protein n=1 Tax=Anabaena sp. CCY 0017 TaxID=3103866 RepID=UPI0039C649BD